MAFLKSARSSWWSALAVDVVPTKSYTFGMKTLPNSPPGEDSREAERFARRVRKTRAAYSGGYRGIPGGVVR